MVRPWSAVPAVALLALMACQAPTPSAATLTIGGSNGMAPLAEAVGLVFASSRPGLSVVVKGGNAASGLLALRQREIDVALVDSPVTDTDLRVVKIGDEAIAVIVHPSNIVSSASVNLLGQVFAGRIRDWSETGGKTGPVTLLTREDGDGARSVLEKALLQGRPVGSIAIITPSDDLMIARVSTDASAIGYVSTRFLSPAVKALKIEGDDPTIGTQYPLVRPLYLVTRQDSQRLAEDFVRFAVSDAGRAITGGTR